MELLKSVKNDIKGRNKFDGENPIFTGSLYLIVHTKLDANDTFSEAAADAIIETALTKLPMRKFRIQCYSSAILLYKVGKMGLSHSYGVLEYSELKCVHSTPTHRLLLALGVKSKKAETGSYWQVYRCKTRSDFNTLSFTLKTGLPALQSTFAPITVKPAEQRHSSWTQFDEDSSYKPIDGLPSPASKDQKNEMFFKNLTGNKDNTALNTDLLVAFGPESTELATLDTTPISSLAPTPVRLRPKSTLTIPSSPRQSTSLSRSSSPIAWRGSVIYQQHHVNLLAHHSVEPGTVFTNEDLKQLFFSCREKPPIGSYDLSCTESAIHLKRSSENVFQAPDQFIRYRVIEEITVLPNAPTVLAIKVVRENVPPVYKLLQFPDDIRLTNVMHLVLRARSEPNCVLPSSAILHAASGGDGDGDFDLNEEAFDEEMDAVLHEFEGTFFEQNDD